MRVLKTGFSATKVKKRANVCWLARGYDQFSDVYDVARLVLRRIGNP